MDKNKNEIRYGRETSKIKLLVFPIKGDGTKTFYSFPHEDKKCTAIPGLRKRILFNPKQYYSKYNWAVFYQISTNQPIEAWYRGSKVDVEAIPESLKQI